MTAGRIRIGVVGAGIGGLTLALALRQRGLAADVYEQASELREIGAAVGLTANGTRELERLGCLDAIAALSTEPTELIWRGWREVRRNRGISDCSRRRLPNPLRRALYRHSPGRPAACAGCGAWTG